MLRTRILPVIAALVLYAASGTGLMAPCIFAQPELEIVEEVPPTGGITPDWIEAIQVLDDYPHQIVFVTRNVGARCGGGTAASAWKLTLDPATGESISLELKQHLSRIQSLRGRLFESSDGNLFTGGGWCGPKPPYVSTDGGETWRAATIGEHPPNSTFALNEFNGEVYAGTGYCPWKAQLYRYIGGPPDDWELIFEIDPPRSILNAMAVHNDRLFIGTSIYWYNGCSICEGTVPVYVADADLDFEPTTGIPSCHTLTSFGLIVVGDELLARTNACGDPDRYLYRWNETLEEWEFHAPLHISPYLTNRDILAYQGIIYTYGQRPGDALGVYMSDDLGLTWTLLVEVPEPAVTCMDVHDGLIYLGTKRDASDIAYIYRLKACLEAWVGDVTSEDAIINVPVEISDVTDRGVYSAEAIVDYDPAVLVPTGFDIAGTLVEGTGWSLIWNEITPGQSKVSMGGVSELSGQGTLVTFTFEVADGAPCPGCTDLVLDILLNEGDPCVTETGDGQYCLPMETISGRVRYYGCAALGNVNPPIAGVEMTCSDHWTQEDSTDSSGHYSFPVCVDSCYSIMAEKAGPESLGISAMDASLVLRYTVGRESLTDCPIVPMLMPDGITWCPEDSLYAQQVAADVSGNGTISAYDASFILKHVVGLDGAQSGEWMFYCDRMDYCPAAGSMENQDYVGLVLGDVTGNWQPGGGPFFVASGAGDQVSIDDASGTPGETVSIPVCLCTTEPIMSLQLSILHDPELLSLESVNAVGLASTWQLVHNPLHGETRIALAGVDPITGSGQILLLEYHVAQDPSASWCYLGPTNIVADEGRVEMAGDSGLFSLEGASVTEDRNMETFFSEVSPNPATRVVEVVLSLPVASPAEAAVYDATGRLVQPLVSNEMLSSGKTFIRWNLTSQNGDPVSPGVYFIKVKCGEYRKTHRVVIIE